MHNIIQFLESYTTRTLANSSWQAYKSNKHFLYCYIVVRRTATSLLTLTLIEKFVVVTSY
jgi:hypothetical protein